MSVLAALLPCLRTIPAMTHNPCREAIELKAAREGELAVGSADKSVFIVKPVSVISGKMINDAPPGAATAASSLHLVKLASLFSQTWSSDIRAIFKSDLWFFLSKNFTKHRLNWWSNQMSLVALFQRFLIDD
jgi:hypothetical protein